MKDMKIDLTATEMMVASYVGSARNVQAIFKAWKHRAKAPERYAFSTHIEGAAGEMAVAKILGMYWEPIVGNPDADDVGPYQVRTNGTRKFQDTCLRPEDRPNRIYISVLCFTPVFNVIGWVTGKEGKQEDWLSVGDPDRPPCYYVPRSVLHPMAELPPPEELLLAQSA